MDSAGVYVGVSYNEYAQLAAAQTSSVSTYTATGGSLSVAAGAMPHVFASQLSRLHHSSDGLHLHVVSKVHGLSIQHKDCAQLIKPLRDEGTEDLTGSMQGACHTCSGSRGRV